MSALSKDQLLEARSIVDLEGLTWNQARYRVLTPEQREDFAKQCRAVEKRRMIENPRREMLRKLKHSCKTLKNYRKRAVDFDLTEADLAWPTHCPVFGIELHYPGHLGHHRDPAGASFDRIDGKLGYVKDNVIIVSWQANRLRSNATSAELRALLNFYEHIDLM